MAMKLDIVKAYDRVEWAFLESLLAKMGFDEIWIKRLMSCISESIELSDFNLLLELDHFNLTFKSLKSPVRELLVECNRRRQPSL